ncbi:MAG: hypothetical protein KBI35_09285 [Ruminococcus sp.]|nr:hypothetical protein [Ruminococcus sp.]
MRKLYISLILGIFWTVLLLALVSPVQALAAEEAQAEIISQVDQILAESDLDLTSQEAAQLSPDSFWHTAKTAVSSHLGAPLRLLGSLVLIAVFSAVARAFSSDESPAGRITDMVAALAAVAVALPQICAIYESTAQVVSRTGGFILVFVPTFAGLTAACGGLTSAGAYNLMILGASEMIVALTNSLLLPILGVISALSISTSAFSSKPSEALVNALRKIIVWGITVAMTLFTGFVSLKCTITGRADTALSKTARFVISGAVPLVGGAVSDAYSTVRGSFDVLRCTVGAAGTAAILLIMVPPVVELLLFRGALSLGAAAAELFSAEGLCKLLRSFDSGLAIAQSVLVCYGLMFLICSAILIQSGG